MTATKTNLGRASRNRQKILDALAVRPMTGREIHDATGIRHESVRKALAILRTPGQKFVYICKHIKSERGNVISPVYALGNKPDSKYVRTIPKPEPEPEKLIEKQRAQERKELPPPPVSANDPWLAWIPRREYRDAA